MELNDLKIPTSVWESAEFVMGSAKHVSISNDGLQSLIEPIRKRFAEGFGDVEDAFGSTGELEKDVNLVFFETAANFCFWAQNPSNKWKFTHGDNTSGGWFGLRNAFAKALDDKVPVYDAKFMATLTIDRAAEIFRGDDGSLIPLLEQRVNNIVEAAEFLLQKHGGSALQFIASCEYDAPTIAEQVTRHLNSFRDGAWYADKWVWILKRAQILPNDLAQLTQKYPEFVIKNKEQLTIFADYKLPQVLRHYDVMVYTDELAERIDTMQLIANGSEEEVEIRAATLVACKRLGELMPDMELADIDVTLWLLSQDAKDDTAFQPHHLSVSYFY